MNCFTKRGAFRIATMAASLLMASAAHAQYLSGYIAGGVHEFGPIHDWADEKYISSTTPTQLNQLVSKSISVGDGAGKEASGMVGGSLGTLKAKAVAKYPHSDSLNYATSHAYVYVLDYLTVTSSTLAQGSVVNLNLKMTLEGSFSNPTFQVGGSYQASAVGGLMGSSSLGSFSKSYQNLNGKPFEDVTATMSAKVGEQITLQYYLDATAYVSGYATVASEAIVDISNTAHIYGSSTDPSVSLIGAGGYNYAATPEPATLAFAGLAVAGLVRRKRNR